MIDLDSILIGKKKDPYSLEMNQLVLQKKIKKHIVDQSERWGLVIAPSLIATIRNNNGLTLPEQVLGEFASVLRLQIKEMSEKPRHVIFFESGDHGLTTKVILVSDRCLIMFMALNLRKKKARVVSCFIHAAAGHWSATDTPQTASDVALGRVAEKLARIYSDCEGKPAFCAPSSPTAVTSAEGGRAILVTEFFEQTNWGFESGFPEANYVGLLSRNGKKK